MNHLLLTTITATLLVGCYTPKRDNKLLKWSERAATSVNNSSLWQGIVPKEQRDELFLRAARDGVLSAVKRHLKYGANANAKEESIGVNALHLASLNGHQKIAEFLLSVGTDVNAKVLRGLNQGMTPLDVAVQFQKPEIVDLLRKHGGKTKKELEAEAKK
jgi:ankyrin repeat protein